MLIKDPSLCSFTASHRVESRGCIIFPLAGYVVSIVIISVTQHLHFGHSLQDLFLQIYRITGADLTNTGLYL